MYGFGIPQKLSAAAPQNLWFPWSLESVLDAKRTLLVDQRVSVRYYVNMRDRSFTNLSLAFFDVDGTLVRRDYSGNLSLKTRAFNFAAETVFGLKGFDYTKILGRGIFGLTDRSIIKTTLSRLSISESEYYAREDELFLAIDDYFEKHVSHENDAGYYQIPGVADFLKLLLSENIRVGLVTGNIKKHALWKLEICGFDNVFTTGGYGEDAELRSHIMRAALERNSDIPLDRICHFGDSPADLIAAQECQVRAVAISSLGGGTHDRAELAATGYGLIIDSWLESASIGSYLA